MNWTMPRLRSRARFRTTATGRLLSLVLLFGMVPTSSPAPAERPLAARMIYTVSTGTFLSGCG